MSQSHIENKDTPDKIVVNNFDDFNFDELDFKPVNKGLGFHHTEKRVSFKKEAMPAKRTHQGKSITKNTPLKAGMKISPSTVSNLGVSQNIKAVTEKSSLDVFYGEKTPLHSHNVKIGEQKLEATEALKRDASYFLNFVAWLVDFILVTFVMLLTIALFVFASGIEFNQLIKLISLTEQVLFVSLVFSTYYILYFSILDLASSPGKVLLGLSLEKIDGKSLRLKNTFVRSVAGLVSLLFLGLPNIFNIPSKLSQTRIVH